MLSEQWFLAMRAMADRAIEAVRKGDTTFHPKRWENVFFNWLENIHDWCISRQLWWGHRIPAYRCVRCDHLIVAAERPSRCPECDGSDIVQDDDVLDTWFSSGLWPMSTLGWPEETADFARYYPTSLLLTGFDIIFFWVARMMMFGLEFTDKVPFKDVYITPLVRDELGKKMTKSKGNVVDPLDLMDQYGADAVRFTLAQLAAQGRDVILSHDRFAASRAFANKIWNAARFVMMNLEGAPQPLPKVEIAKLGLAERWILSRLDATIREVSGSIDAYEFNVAAMKLYDFIWHEFCDWYIELSKEPLKAGGERQAGARWVLINVFDKMLRLLHPFMPFVSEEIWQVIRPYLDEANLARHLPIAKYPEPSATNPLSASRRTRDESLYRGNRSDQLAALAAGMASRAARHRGDQSGRQLASCERAGDVEALCDDTRESRGVECRLRRKIAQCLRIWRGRTSASMRPTDFDFEVARQKLQKQLDEVEKHAATRSATERRTLYDESRSRNASRSRAAIRGLASASEVAERAIAATGRTRMNAPCHRTTSPCHSERSEESGGQCGDMHPQAWRDRFARKYRRSVSTDIGEVWTVSVEKDPGFFAALRMTQKIRMTKAKKSDTKIRRDDVRLLLVSSRALRLRSGQAPPRDPGSFSTLAAAALTTPRPR